MKIHTKTLYLVATPIGHLQDITTRAVDVLRHVDKIAAEDPRKAHILQLEYGISTPVTPLHQHNEAQQAEKLVSFMQGGGSVALVSDAGTPLLSDPGFILVQKVIDAGLNVVPIPGPCAIIAALCAAGLPTLPFQFHGFLSPKAGPRQKAVQGLAREITHGFYESPRRLGDLLQALAQHFGADTPAVVARELTKQFESFYRGTLGYLQSKIADGSLVQKGECVVLVHAAMQGSEGVGPEALQILHVLLQELPKKQAIKIAVLLTGCSRNALYAAAVQQP